MSDVITRKLVLHFPPESVDKPVVSSLVRDYRIDVNILKASIEPSEEGLMVVELAGESLDFESGLGYLEEIGVSVEPLSQDIRRNEERCSSCGACVGVCHTGALYVERPSMVVAFREDECVACEHCVSVCPLRAMEIHY
ncbi:MAG: NIL domain-containing protein [Candidatus Geothermincolia bacterium]